MTEELVPPGRYRHYKGGTYEVYFVARHSETLEELVVYRALTDCRTGGKDSMWVRPKSMFTEYVHYEGREVQRFRPENIVS